MNLSEAPILQGFRITAIHDATLEIKLLELSFSVHSTLEVLRRAPLRGPLTLKNDKAQIIIRREDARLIEVIPAL